ncbi:hypothetical protein DL93DRAFT_2096209 [Clavulina sp. PMI_390]|nr:hypothetical protein DL93DRAFT_2096209 [Clavulina sp. PMI_390]
MEVKAKNGVAMYHVLSRSIPVEWLELVSLNEPPITQHKKYLVFPCGFRHSEDEAEYLLFTQSEESRAEWKKNAGEAINKRRGMLLGIKALYATETAQPTFGTLFPPIDNGSHASPDRFWDKNIAHSDSTGTLGHSAQQRALSNLEHAEPSSGDDLIDIKSENIDWTEQKTDGDVWIESKVSAQGLQRAASTSNVTQCALLPDLGVLLILVNKTLVAFHVRDLTWPRPASSMSEVKIHRLSMDHQVEFFRAGIISGRAVAKRIFCVLESFADVLCDSSNASNDEKVEWFKTLRIKSAAIPQSTNPCHTILLKGLTSRRSLGMFRFAEEKFLLSYDEFALHAETLASPAFRQGRGRHCSFLRLPTVLYTNLQLVKVRHIFNDKLVPIHCGQSHGRLSIKVARGFIFQHGGGEHPNRFSSPESWRAIFLSSWRRI